MGAPRDRRPAMRMPRRRARSERGREARRSTDDRTSREPPRGTGNTHRIAGPLRRGQSGSLPQTSALVEPGATRSLGRARLARREGKVWEHDDVLDLGRRSVFSLEPAAERRLALLEFPHPREQQLYPVLEQPFGGLEARDTHAYAFQLLRPSTSPPGQERNGTHEEECRHDHRETDGDHHDLLGGTDPERHPEDGHVDATRQGAVADEIDEHERAQDSEREESHTDGYDRLLLGEGGCSLTARAWAVN